MLFICSQLCDCIHQYWVHHWPSVSSLALPAPLSWRGLKPVANTVLLTPYTASLPVGLGHRTTIF